jgi:hypothetical protein
MDAATLLASIASVETLVVDVVRASRNFGPTPPSLQDLYRDIIHLKSNIKSLGLRGVAPESEAEASQSLSDCNKYLSGWSRTFREGYATKRWSIDDEETIALLRSRINRFSAMQ